MILRNLMKSVFLPLLVLNFMSGCMTTHYTFPNSPVEKTEYAHFDSFLGQVAPVEARNFCEGKFHQVTFQQSFSDVLLSWCTFGMLQRETVTLQCGR